TYNTTIAFDNLDLRLFPGMTAYVSIPVATANNVVKIPNGALRFKPDLTDSERKTLYAKYNITDNASGTAGGRIAARGSPAPGGQGGAATPPTGAGGGQNGGRGPGANTQRADTGVVCKQNPDKPLEPVQVGLGVT